MQHYHHYAVLSFSRGARFGSFSDSFKMLDAFLIHYIKTELLGSNITTFVISRPVGATTTQVELHVIIDPQYTTRRASGHVFSRTRESREDPARVARGELTARPIAQKYY